MPRGIGRRSPMLMNRARPGRSVPQFTSAQRAAISDFYRKRQGPPRLTGAPTGPRFRPPGLSAAMDPGLRARPPLLPPMRPIGKPLAPPRALPGPTGPRHATPVMPIHGPPKPVTRMSKLKSMMDGRGKYAAGVVAAGLVLNGIRSRSGAGADKPRGRSTGPYMY